MDPGQDHTGSTPEPAVVRPGTGTLADLTADPRPVTEKSQNPLPDREQCSVRCARQHPGSDGDAALGGVDPALVQVRRGALGHTGREAAQAGQGARPTAQVPG